VYLYIDGQQDVGKKERSMGKYVKYEEVTILGVTQRFCWIPSGKFMMGSPEEEPERCSYEQQHEVEISQGFWLADTVCTQELWQAVMGENPSRFNGEDRPVDSVSWEDCQDFINKINNIEPGLKFRLPREAEWEYSCRAGTTSPFYFGENITTEQANFNGNYPYSGGERGEYRKETVAVKFFPSNGWGIYGMHGNVLEWCEDWYGEYATGRVVDPRGPESGDYRVLRGGSWFGGGWWCRSACRLRGLPGYRGRNIGFRLVRGPVEEKEVTRRCSDEGEAERRLRGTTKRILGVVQFVFIDETGNTVDIAEYGNPYRKDGSFLKHIQDMINAWIDEDIDSNGGSRKVHILRVKD
jgi:formylglycine-generating enzyme required for sulfatase activity